MDEVDSGGTLDIALSREVVAGLGADSVELNMECLLKSWRL